MNKKLEWTANVLTDHIMQGAETVTYNKEEMMGIMTSTIMAINTAKIKGGINGFWIGVGCCGVAAYYAHEKQKKNGRVESK